MNMLITLLQAAPAGQPQGSSWSMWIMLLLVFVVKLNMLKLKNY